MLNFYPVKYSLNPEWSKHLSLNVSIEHRGTDFIGNPLFCVKFNDNLLMKDGSLEWEPSVSQRPEDFIKNSRYTLAEAMNLANNFIPPYLLKFMNQPNVKKFILANKSEHWAQILIKEYL